MISLRSNGGVIDAVAVSGGRHGGKAGSEQTARVALKTYRASWSSRCLPMTAHAKTAVSTTPSPARVRPVIHLEKKREDIAPSSIANASGVSKLSLSAKLYPASGHRSVEHWCPERYDHSAFSRTITV